MTVGGRISPRTVLASSIIKLSLNELAIRTSRSDRENYVDGNAQFLFEYAAGGDESFEGVCDGRKKRPTEIPIILAEPNNPAGPKRKVQRLRAQDVEGQAGVICRWDQEPVLIGDVQFMDQVEEFIPARLTVRFEVCDRVDEPLTHPWGQSVCYAAS